MKPRCHSRVAFTMIEAAFSIAITAVAGSAILLGINNSLDVTNDVVNQTIAEGMAEQLLDEALGKVYAAPGEGPYSTSLSHSSYEDAGTGRERYNDIDDFNAEVSSPPTDLYGKSLGTDNGQGGTRPTNFQIPSSYFSRWKQIVDVYYVNATNFSQRLTGNNTSDYRAVDVKILYNDPVRGWWQLAEARRVITYLQVP